MAVFATFQTFLISRIFGVSSSVFCIDQPYSGPRVVFSFVLGGGGHLDV